MDANKKLWSKNSEMDVMIESFIIGEDQALDMHLAEFDVLGSLAHIKMLHSVGLLTAAEYTKLKPALQQIYHEIKQGTFTIDEQCEDVHSQVEFLLTERLGDMGKKIHSGRSRNDQALLDIRLFIRNRIKQISDMTHTLFQTLIKLSEQYKATEMPGYTHTQVAMPSSFGLWFAAFAESLADDLLQLKTGYEIINKNPLGSAAGYGSSFPLDRELTTKLLGFNDLNYNSIYAQAGRGKSERIVSMALASFAETLGRMSADIILFLSQNFSFISFPDSLTTGSSIMPHKKNPDLFEIIRARCNRIKALPNQIMMINTNLITGYHRDLQLIKESFIPALDESIACLNVMNFALKQIHIRHDVLDDERYKYIFSVERVNELVKNGLSFRDAYHKVAQEVDEGRFERIESMEYTHLGSSGNLANDKIVQMMDTIIHAFNFKSSQNALEGLLK